VLSCHGCILASAARPGPAAAPGAEGDFRARREESGRIGALAVLVIAWSGVDRPARSGAFRSGLFARRAAAAAT